MLLFQLDFSQKSIVQLDVQACIHFYIFGGEKKGKNQLTKRANILIIS